MKNMILQGINFIAAIAADEAKITELLNRDILGEEQSGYSWLNHIEARGGSVELLPQRGSGSALLISVKEDEPEPFETVQAWLDLLFGSLTEELREALPEECRKTQEALSTQPASGNGVKTDAESPEAVRELAKRAGIYQPLEAWFEATENCSRNAKEPEQFPFSTVLIVEDETKLRNRCFKIMARWLKALGVIKEGAENLRGLRAIPEGMFKERSFVALTDAIWFPGVDKYEVYTEAPKIYSTVEKSPAVFVLALTREHFRTLEPNLQLRAAFPFLCDSETGTEAEKDEAMKKKVLEETLASYGLTLVAGDGKMSLNRYSAEELRRLASAASVRKLSQRHCSWSLSSRELFQEKETNSALLFDRLTGLGSVKEKIREIAAYVRNRGVENLSSLHMVFSGNPGTGKTMTARLLGQILYEEGAIAENKFIEADRGAIVGKYVGESAQKVKAVIDSALGGVLFIDEAYSLYSGSSNDYGAEVVAALVKAMEDHRRDLVCIFAGYPEPMKNMLDMNPGFRSRIQFYLDFPDYSEEELASIFTDCLNKGGYEIESEALAEARSFISAEAAAKNENFANARTIRTFYERVCFKQALRGKTDLILPEDIKTACAEIRKSSAQPQRMGF